MRVVPWLANVLTRLCPWLTVVLGLHVSRVRVGAARGWLFLLASAKLAIILHVGGGSCCFFTPISMTLPVVAIWELLYGIVSLRKSAVLGYERQAFDRVFMIAISLFLTNLAK